MLIGVAGQTLDLIVENQGHINFGTQINNGSKVSHHVTCLLLFAL